MTRTTQPEAVAGLRHGPLEGQDLSLLTQQSVLLCPADQSPGQHFGPMGLYRETMTVEGQVLVGVSQQPGALFSPGRFTYIGERDADGVIRAPADGWKSDPIPTVEVADFMMSDGRWYEKQRKPRFWHLVAAFRLTDANPQQEAGAELSGNAGDLALETAIDWMELAAAMLGRGEMPAPGSAYAANWCMAHGVVLEAARRSMSQPQQEGASLPGGEDDLLVRHNKELRKALISLVEHFERVDAPEESRAVIKSACKVYARAVSEQVISAPPTLKSGDREALLAAMREHIVVGEIGTCSVSLDGFEDAADAILALLRPAGEYEGLIERLERSAEAMSAVEMIGIAAKFTEAAAALRQLTDPDASMKERG